MGDAETDFGSRKLARELDARWHTQELQYAIRFPDALLLLDMNQLGTIPALPNLGVSRMNPTELEKQTAAETHEAPENTEMFEVTDLDEVTGGHAPFSNGSAVKRTRRSSAQERG